MPESELRKAKRARRQLHGHWIYAISDGTAVKVGYAIDIGARLRDLQAGNPRALHIADRWRVMSWKNSQSELTNAKCWERFFHKRLAKHRLRGEWFSLDALGAFKEARSVAGATWDGWQRSKLLPEGAPTKQQG